MRHFKWNPETLGEGKPLVILEIIWYKFLGLSSIFYMRTSQ